MAKEPKGKKAEKGEGDAAASGRLRLADHPRAQRHIQAARSWGGLLGFVVVAVLGLRAGVPAVDALMRALLAGIVGMTVCRLGMVLAWQHIAAAEVEAFRQALVAELQSRDGR